MSIYAVLDHDQTMYLFTGARPEIMMHEIEEYFPNLQTIKLAINYRSDQSVINTGEKLIRYNYQPHGPYEEQYMKDVVPRSGAPEGLQFTLDTYPSAEDEADGVADSIMAYLQPTEEDGIEIRNSPGSIFVGARTRAQLAYLEGPLMRRDVPFINITGGSFWESKHAMDVVAYVKLASDYNDGAAFARVYNIASAWMTMPWRKSPQYGEYCDHRFLGKEFLAQCKGSFINIHAASQARYSWQPGADDLNSFVAEIGFRDNPADAVRFVLDECYVRYLKSTEGLTTGDEAENGKIEDLETVWAIARDFETIPEFLAYVDECITTAKKAAGGDWGKLVVLSTVHRLKGLERDVVYGLGLGEGERALKNGDIVPAGLLPHSFSLAPPPQFGVLPSGGQGRIEDERALCYVLVTRARHLVHLSYPQTYRNCEFGPSRFLAEMGIETE